jgi:phytoene/squalene synthetase
MTNAENIGAPAAKAVKKKASTSSFYIAMRLMPAEERDAMFAIYAFCRKVDDIADDGVGTRAERHERLEQWRDDLRALYAGTVAPQVRFLAPAVSKYGLRLQDFLSILDGMDNWNKSTHGRSGVGRWVLGSVTEKVVRHSDDPVLVVHAG